MVSWLATKVNRHFLKSETETLACTVSAHFWSGAREHLLAHVPLPLAAHTFPELSLIIQLADLIKWPFR